MSYNPPNGNWRENRKEYNGFFFHKAYNVVLRTLAYPGSQRSHKAEAKACQLCRMKHLRAFTLRTESPSIFLDKSGRGRNRVASSFPTYIGKIEATLLAG